MKNCSVRLLGEGLQHLVGRLVVPAGGQSRRAIGSQPRRQEQNNSKKIIKSTQLQLESGSFDYVLLGFHEKHTHTRTRATLCSVMVEHVFKPTLHPSPSRNGVSAAPECPASADNANAE
jgi:hypothetical protein